MSSEPNVTFKKLYLLMKQNPTFQKHASQIPFFEEGYKKST